MAPLWGADQYRALWVRIFIFTGSTEIIAGDIKAGLDSEDGTTKFSVRDSSENEVAYIDSDGNAYFEGNITASLPTEDDQVATKGYVDAASGGGKPVWSGYTSTAYTGNMGGILGMNDKCHSEYSGSHACTYDEILKLGNSYPKTTYAWVIDGDYYFQINDDLILYTKDNFTYKTSKKSTCYAWTSYSTLQVGPVITMTTMAFDYCSNGHVIPCCE